MKAATRPLADRMRPSRIEDFVGQEDLLAPGKALREMLERGALRSLILWGPPGTGKTTLARMLAEASGHRFVTLSAVTSGVKDIRAVVEDARVHREQGRGTVLFVDEVHRFNKAQQDGFLPHLEDGTLVFIGATTENPSFELNRALLSRARVYVLKPLDVEHIARVIDRALTDAANGLGGIALTVTDDARELLATAAGGDARRALEYLESAADLAVGGADPTITAELAREAVGRRVVRFDKGGDDFYDQISALHKSIRGSSPDGALYWLARMLEGGVDPAYLARRLVRIASEDIGNADPRALTLSREAWDVWDRLGSPEGELAIAQAAVYLACAAKSNAVYKAYNAARADAREHGELEVPAHLRNAPTRLMRELGAGAGYRYAHDEPEGYAAGEHYLPDALAARRYYQPTERGLEARIGDKLDHLRELDRKARGATPRR